MPSLNFVMPHWLYWSGLLLFPLISMYVVRRSAEKRVRSGLSLPLAYLFWLCSGFLGIHRYYLRSMLGLIYLPLFVGILFGNVETRDARQIVSNAHSEAMTAEFLIERAQQRVDAGAADAQQQLAEAREQLETAQADVVAAEGEQDFWDTVTGTLGALILLFLLIDAVLLPGMVRRRQQIEQPRAEGPPVVEPVEAGTHEDPTWAVHTPVTDVIDRISGFMGEFVAYWSLIAVFVYYYEVLARYVFNSPTNWAHESMFLMFGMQYLIAGAFALREDSHVRVDVVYLKLPARVRVFVDIFTSIFFFIFVVALLWTGMTFAMDSMSVWEVSFTEWAIQYWPVKLTIPLGALLLTLQGLSKLIKDFRLL